MNREDFIDTQVDFQLGTITPRQYGGLKELVNTDARGRVSMILYDPADGSITPADRGYELKRIGENRWTENVGKHVKPLYNIRALRNSDMLNELFDKGMASAVIIDMQDAVRRPNAFPVFQYARMSGAENSILWPHRRVHQVGASEFCHPPNTEGEIFSEKKPVVFWRGSPRGFSSLGGEAQNIRPIIRRYLENEIGSAELVAHLETVPRYKFVSRYFDCEGFDVGFTLPQSLARYSEVPEITRFLKPFTRPEEQRKCKYLISVQGTDVGSSFGWQLSSNSMLFKEDYPWEVFFSCHFRPFEHYLPIALDFTNLPERISWCEANPAACEEMIAKRHQMVRYTLEPDTREKILRGVVGRYNEIYARWRKAG